MTTLVLDTPCHMCTSTSVTSKEFLDSCVQTEKAFASVLEQLTEGAKDAYVHLMTLADTHKDLRERLLCRVAAEGVDITDLCVDTVKTLEGQRALMPALRVIVEDYRTHWRLKHSVFYKRRPFPLCYDGWTKTMVRDGREFPILY